MPEGEIRAYNLEIDMDQAPLSLQNFQRPKLYNIATLTQKIQL